MIVDGKIISFTDIFKFIPKTIVAKDLGKKVDRFTELMTHVEEFMLEDLFMIATFCDIDEAQILKLVLNEYLKNKSQILRSSAPF